MEVEFRTISSSSSIDKKNFQSKTNDYKNECTQLYDNYKKVKINYDNIIIKSNLQSQTKISSYNQKLDSSTSLLEKSRQTLAQTDALGR
jgi:hypothetical protein